MHTGADYIAWLSTWWGAGLHVLAAALLPIVQGHKQPGSRPKHRTPHKCSQVQTVMAYSHHKYSCYGM